MYSQKVLRDETLKLLQKRKRSNPRYSKKDLASELGIHRISLYQFLSGKRVLKKKTALKYFKNKFDETCWKTIDDAFGWDETSGESVAPIKIYESDEDYPKLTQDQFDFNSDPLCWSLLFLMELEDYSPDVKWKANKLGISEADTQRRIDLLLRLELIRWDGSRLVRTSRRVLTTDLKVNPAIKTFKRKLVSYLEKAIDLDPRTEQDIYSWTCAIDPKDLPKFQRMIRKFAKTFDQKQLASKPKQVYTLMFSLFPISK